MFIRFFSLERPPANNGAIALSYLLGSEFRATVKLSAAFFNVESSVTMGWRGGERGDGGLRKCNIAQITAHSPKIHCLN